MILKFGRINILHALRTMSTTHLEKTKNVIRDPHVFTSATVRKITSISPTVKFLKIHVDNAEFSFKPGQWVDFIVPGLSTVGGFSMCSSPSLLKTDQLLDLAVKYSTHPPAYWVHNECADGNRVNLQVGGEYYFEMSRQNLGDNLLLVAAGVGINPILSMMKHVYAIHQLNLDAEFGKTILLYTTTTMDELIFEEDISSIESNDKSFTSFRFVTRQSPESVKENIIPRRMNEKDLIKAVDGINVNPEDIISYICAPAPMMNDIEDMLKNIGLRKQNIRYESWW